MLTTAAWISERVPHQTPRGLAPEMVIPLLSMCKAYASAVKRPATSRKPVLLERVRKIVLSLEVLLETSGRLIPSEDRRSSWNVAANSLNVGGINV